MKQLVLCFLFTVCCLSAIRSQNTLPVKYFYFDDKFELKDSATATYYAIAEPGVRKLYIATLYNLKEIKVATITYANKELTVKNGEMNGFYESGDIQYTTNYSNNNLDGPWISWYPDGQHCDSGKFKNNLPDGTWMSWYPNGQLRMAADFSAKKYGEVQEEVRKLSRHTSSGVQNAKEVTFGGTAPFYEENISRLMEKSLQPPEIIGNSQRLSLKTKIDHNSITGFNYDVDYAPPFTHCLMHGYYKSFFPDGTMREYGFYNNGLRSGDWVEWNEDDAIRSSGIYKKGVRTGEWRRYSRFDRLVSVHWYP